RQFVRECQTRPIAPDSERANEQHYDVPAEFFALALGPHHKYSCCHWGDGIETLEQAEASSLTITCERAELADGMKILELGCGWGSLSLWMAEHYPAAQVTAVSNSASQRKWIEDRAAERGVKNLHVITADMNDFDIDGEFDRVVSVEMFEHMRNHAALLERIHRWLRPGGKLFVHVFCHRSIPYLFRTQGPANWMGRYFFTGGMMPSDDLLPVCSDRLALERHWRWSGRHYEKTCNAWLERTDRHRDAIRPILAATYGEAEADRWLCRWRLFFMACAELFGDRAGKEWHVSHYRFRR
ncbi:MAG: SAM-dependent methyltransferase, partial [Maioricimonas sp. JB049]